MMEGPSRQHGILIREDDQQWQPLPRWVEFLIRMGYSWPRNAPGQRTIAVVSMPCDSAAAGLIALGGLVRDLENPNANDIDGHYEALLRYAQQYLGSCHDCRVPCHPEQRGCGYSTEATGILRHKDRTAGRIFEINERFSIRAKSDWFEQAIGCRVSSKGGDVRTWVFRRSATDWCIDGQPIPQLTNHGEPLLGDPYLQVIQDAQIFPDNLRRSYSGLCFAGRAAGENASRQMCASLRFRGQNGEYGLPELLTVHGWSRASVVSRVALFNSRTQKFDRLAPAPVMAIADGEAAFLKILSRPEFQRSDVIGVVHRTMERERLEAVGTRLVNLRQWYEEAAEMIASLGVIPRGISVVALRKRTG